MSIILTEPIMIAGALVAVDGTTKTYNAAFEADQVAAGKAKWAPGSPAIGGRRVPLEVVMDSAQGVVFTSMMLLTQAQYDALAVKDAAVMYVIVG